MEQEKIGKFIAELRKEKNMTQKELAEKLGVTDRAISKWETGRGMPDLSLLKPLSKIFDITINDLLSGEKVDKKDYQEKFEENMMQTMKTVAKNAIKQAVKKVIKIILMTIVIGVILFIVCVGIALLIYQPVYLKKEDVDFTLCRDADVDPFRGQAIHVEINVKDKMAVAPDIDFNDDKTTANFRFYRAWIETKIPSLLDDDGTGTPMLDGYTKEIYHDGELIWDSSQELEICK